MEHFRVALFGHRALSEYKRLEGHLRDALHDLIRRGLTLEVLIGRNGEFDAFAASIVKRLMHAVGKECLSLTLILPYPKANRKELASYYDDIQIPECLNGIHPKQAIRARNHWMVENCDLVVGYVEREHGGAYEALCYAERIGKPILRLREAEHDWR